MVSISREFCQNSDYVVIVLKPMLTNVLVDFQQHEGIQQFVRISHGFILDI